MFFDVIFLVKKNQMFSFSLIMANSDYLVLDQLCNHTSRMSQKGITLLHIQSHFHDHAWWLEKEINQEGAGDGHGVGEKLAWKEFNGADLLAGYTKNASHLVVTKHHSLCQQHPFCEWQLKVMYATISRLQKP